VRLDALCPAARVLRSGSPLSLAPARQDAEIVLVMGLPGAGKSTLAREFGERGYLRLNRDDVGGTLRDLVPALDRALVSGASRIVLDNTYVSRKSRAAVIQAAAARGVPVRCVWLSTSIEDAQVNAATRLIDRYGTLPGESELATRRKHDVGAFLPGAQFRYLRELEAPDPAEGFRSIDVLPFERRLNPAHVNRAVVIWCDGILLGSRSDRRVPADAEDVVVDRDRGAVLGRYHARGFRLLGLSWQPEMADGQRSVAAVDSVFARMNELLGLSIEVAYCPHAGGPPRCWCRKPLPGLGVLFIQRHNLNPAACIYVGEGAHDPGFARRLGFQYRRATDFFDAANG
jgi:predicted kinase/histidinol phosphatase-like enzyme